MNDDRIREMIVKAQKDDREALNELILASQYIIKRIARKYNAIYYEDLVQEGNLAIYDAIKSFDFSRGINFETFASTIINAYLYEVVNQFNLINIPPYKRREFKEMQDIANEHLILYGQEISETNLCQKMDITQEQLKRLKKLPVFYTSLDEICSDKMNEYLHDDNIWNVFDVDDRLVEEKRWNELINNIIYLSKREKQVISLRYGFKDKSYTLIEIGNLLGISTTLVAEIEKDALWKLRNNGERRTRGSLDIETKKKFELFVVENKSKVEDASMMTNLTDKEIIVITNKYGLFGKNVVTLNKTAKLMGLSAETVKNIVNRAIYKIIALNVLNLTEVDISSFQDKQAKKLALRQEAMAKYNWIRR